MVIGHQPSGFKTAIDLRARTVYQHQTHTQTVQQHQVVDDIAKVGVRYTVAGEHDDKGAVAVGIDVGRRVTQPVNVIVHNQSL